MQIWLQAGTFLYLTRQGSVHCFQTGVIPSRHPRGKYALLAARTGKTTIHAVRFPTRPCEEITLLSGSAKRECDDSYSLPAAPRHCECSEAIRCTRMDCFIPFAKNEGYYRYRHDKEQSHLTYGLRRLRVLQRTVHKSAPCTCD
jgi:hypothetical protein